MEQVLQLMNDYTSIGFIILFIVVIVLITLLYITQSKLDKLEKKFVSFTGGGQDKANIEKMLIGIHEENRLIAQTVGALNTRTAVLEDKIKKCLSKLYVVRYNPFEEMGGNLSYALALMDEYENGVVLNGIHNRSGSFTYAKALEKGESAYALSAEEVLAIDKAKKQ